jgi:hypothetical protein
LQAERPSDTTINAIAEFLLGCADLGQELDRIQRGKSSVVSSARPARVTTQAISVRWSTRNRWWNWQKRCETGRAANDIGSRPARQNGGSSSRTGLCSSLPAREQSDCCRRRRD